MFTKRRRILGGLICITSLLLIVSLGYIIGMPKRLNSLFIDDTKYSQITDERYLDENLYVSSLKIAGYDAFITKDKIYYSLIDGDKYAYNPSVSIGSPYKIAFRGEAINDWDIEHNNAIDVLIYDDTSYREFKFVSTTLPLLSLDFENGSVPNNRSNDNFSMKLFDNRKEVLDRTITSDGKAHMRGGTSYGKQKANLSMKLTYESVGGNTRKNSVSILGMQERSNYVLSGMYFDYEKVRDMFGSTLWREASNDRNSFNLDLSYDWRYVEVIMDGDYYGLFMIGYKPDETVFNLSTEGEHPDILFKAADGEDFSDFILGNSTVLANYELKSDTDTIYSYNVLREYMRAMYSNDISKALEWSDYNNAIDFWLFTNVTQNDDIPRSSGMYKNAYICFKWNGEHYKAVFIPWDHDIAIGTNSLNGNMYERTPDQNVFLDTDMVAAFQRAEDKEYQQVIKNRYAELRMSVWSLHRINDLIDDYENQIFNSGAFLRDEARWPESNHINSYEKLSRFRAFITDRISYTDSHLFETENRLNLQYVIPNYLTVYLETGKLLSPDDPEYYEKIEVDDDVSADTRYVPEDELVGF